MKKKQRSISWLDIIGNEKNGFHLPPDFWNCLDCGKEWYAEYSSLEFPVKCPFCNGYECNKI